MGYLVRLGKLCATCGVDIVYEIIYQAYDSEIIPSTWKENPWYHLLKEKGTSRNGEKYKRIKLMSPVHERVMDKRLRECTEITEAQFVFMSGRSTTDAIFPLGESM